MTIETTTRIWKEGTQYIAHALPLDVASAGSTADEARRALQEAVELFIATARTQGTLDEVLEECGIHVRREQLDCAADRRRTARCDGGLSDAAHHSNFLATTLEGVPSYLQ